MLHLLQNADIFMRICGFNMGITIILLYYLDNQEHTQMLYVNEYIITECLWIELKQFSFFDKSKFTRFTNYQIQNMIETKDFTQILDYSSAMMNKYISYYLPKYMTSFINNHTINYGLLLFGVTDFGIITGIPIGQIDENNNLKYTINLHDLNIIVSNIIADVVGSIPDNWIGDKELLKNTLNEVIQIRITPLKQSTSIMDEPETDTYIEKQNELCENYIRQAYTYASERNEWAKWMKYYKRSINTLLNDRKFRDDLIKFIESRNINDQMFDNNNDQMFDNNVCEDIVVALSSNIMIELDIKCIKDDRKNINHLAYWVTTYRDLCVTECKKNKPCTTLPIKPLPPYTYILSRYTPLVSTMLENRYVMGTVHLCLPGGNFLREFNLPQIGYTDPRNGNVRTSRRTVINGEPCCL